MNNSSIVSRRPFLLSATVDFPDDLRSGIYTTELLDQMMLNAKSMGVTRIYWLYYGDAEADSYWAGWWTGHIARNNGPATIERIGEPLKAAVQAAHKHGLEIFGVLKPYDVGISGTYPEGSSESGATELKRIGGTVRAVFPFLERHPQTIIHRRPYISPPDLHTTPIRKIRLLKQDDSPTRIKKENLEIWTSPVNYRYERKDATFTLREAVESAPRKVTDSFGNLVCAKGSQVRTLTLEGLNLTDRYVLITTNFKDGNGDFRNTSLGMIEAYGSGPEPLPIVVGSRTSLWDERDFRTNGLEFDSGFGHYLSDLDVDNTAEKENIRWRTVGDDGLIAFAKGKNATLPCSPCEIYPEVRKLWAGWVDRILATGVDGMSIRSSSHGTLTDEPQEYGFNDVVVEAYRERYGEDLLGDAGDLKKLARLRGEYYTDFIRETSRKVRRAGKRMQVHLHPDLFRDVSNPRPGKGSSANIHFDWKGWLKEGLADGATMRLNRFEGITDPETGIARRGPLSRILDEEVILDMLTVAEETGVPVYLNGFAALVNSDEFASDMGSIYNDRRFAGFDIYENASIQLPTPDGSQLLPVEGFIKNIRAKLTELKLL